MAELPDEEDRGYAPASRPRRHPVEEEETAASPSSSLDFAAPFHAAVFFLLLLLDNEICALLMQKSETFARGEIPGWGFQEVSSLLKSNNIISRCPFS